VKAYGDYEAFLPEELERHKAILESQNVVMALHTAWINKGLTWEQYKKALSDLELITGIAWS